MSPVLVSKDEAPWKAYLDGDEEITVCVACFNWLTRRLRSYSKRW